MATSKKHLYATKRYWKSSYSIKTKVRRQRGKLPPRSSWGSGFGQRELSDSQIAVKKNLLNSRNSKTSTSLEKMLGETTLLKTIASTTKTDWVAIGVVKVAFGSQVIKRVNFAW